MNPDWSGGGQPADSPFTRACEAFRAWAERAVRRILHWLEGG